MTVVAESSTLQTNTGQMSKTIESKQIQDLMLNGRNPINLALLKPGVRGGAFNNFQPDSLTNGGFDINGSRADENLITIDGAIAIRTRSAGAIIGTLNVDTVQEIQVLTASYLPEYGRSSGGQIRFVTKSGGRDFHGDIFGFFRDEGLDANSWTRNRAGLDARRAVQLQAVRLRRRRAGRDPGQVQREPRQAVLLLGAGVDRLVPGGARAPASSRARRCATATSASC